MFTLLTLNTDVFTLTLFTLTWLVYGAHLAVLDHDSDDARAVPLLLLVWVCQDQIPTQPHAQLELCRILEGVHLLYLSLVNPLNSSGLGATNDLLLFQKHRVYCS